jgi:multicomponent Na+:H+ antiporter subunit F
MNTFFTIIGSLLLFLMILPLYRLIKGPDVISRILGANVIGAKATIVIILVGTIYGRVEMFVDIAIAYALLNFIAALAASRLFQRSQHLTPKEDS